MNFYMTDGIIAVKRKWSVKELMSTVWAIGFIQADCPFLFVKRIPPVYRERIGVIWITRIGTDL